MNGIRYQSPEHYYQATKLYALCGYEVAARIQYVREPFKAKTVTKGLLRQYGVPHQSVEAWKQTDGLVTLMYAAALKFIQNQELREKLLDTKDNLIVEAHTDHFFAGRYSHLPPRNNDNLSWNAPGRVWEMGWGACRSDN